MKNNHFLAVMTFLITMGYSMVQVSTNNDESITSQPGTLFKISRTGNADSYLYAISHSADATTTQVHPNINAILDEVEGVAMELKMDDPNLQQNIMKHIGMKDGQKLSSIYTKEQFTEVDEFFVKTLGAGLSNFETFKPMALQSYLLPSFLGNQVFSFETVLITTATQKGKPLLGLETVENQLAAFDTFDYNRQAEILYQMVKNDADLKQQYIAVNEAYDAGNMGEVYAITQSILGTSGCKAIFDERNDQLAMQISEQTAQQPLLIALGAGHFGGSNGLLKLLQQKGFSISPIK